MGKRIFGDGPAWRQLRETTANQPVVSAAPPASVVLPVGDREVLVTVGAMVKVGQVIARSGALLAAPVHTSIAGKVTAIDRVPLSDGSRQLAVVIENDGTDAVFASVQPGGKLEVPALRDWLFAAGIDLPMSGGTIETVIVNAAGSEPSITADYRLLVEQAPDLVTGLLAAMRALEAAKGIVVVDSRENAAAEAVRQALPDGGSILVLALNNRYPAAARRYLRRDALGKGQAPGTFILDTAAAVAAGVAVSRGLPYIEKVVTLAGSGVKEPKNLRVRLGTRFSDVLAAGGEFDGVVGQVIAGGPLTGNLVGSLAVPVTKAVDGIIAIAKADVRAEAAGKCIRCGYCVSACPVGLLPLSLGDLVEAKRVPETLGYHLADCIECGVCAYECPAKRPLLHYIQLAKAELAK